MLTMSKKRVSRGELCSWLGWYSVWVTLLTALVFFRFTTYIETPSTGLGWSYLFSTWIGHAALLSSLSLPLLLGLALIYPFHKLLTILSILLSSVGLTLLILDSFVFDQYRFHINGFVLDLIIHDSDGQIFDFSLASKLIALIGVAFIFWVQTVAALWLWRHLDRIRSAQKGRWIGSMLFMLLLSSHGIHAYAHAMYLSDVTRQARFYPLHFPTEAKKELAQWGFSNPEAEKQAALLRGGSGVVRYPLQPMQCEAPQVQKNILLIAVDSWRFDTADTKTAPNVAQFAHQYGTAFTNHYSGGNGTRTGVFSMFYGLPGTYWDAMASSSTPALLIQQLQQQRYALGIFSNAKLTSPAFDKTVFASVDNLRIETKGRSSAERDQQLTEDWLQWLASHQQAQSAEPFFGFLFYDAPHSYSPITNYPEIFSPAWESVNFLALNNNFDPEPFFNRYKNAVHFTDSQIGRVLEDLKQRNLLENTLVVITADHGQEFNDNKKNYWGHGSNFTRYQLQVPLIVAGGHFPKGETIDYATSHFDLAPTLLTDLAGCQNDPKDYSSGRHLLAHSSDPSQVSWRLAGAVGNYGVIESDRITVTYQTGQYEILSPEYEPQSDASLNMATLGQVLKEMSRFYQ